MEYEKLLERMHTRKLYFCTDEKLEMCIRDRNIPSCPTPIPP